MAQPARKIQDSANDRRAAIGRAFFERKQLQKTLRPLDADRASTSNVGRKAWRKG